MKKLWLAAALLAFSAGGQAKTIVDILNRQVEVPDNPQRLIVGESRMIYTLALVEDGNPAKRVVGWPADLKRLDPQTWDRYSAAYPSINDITVIGNNNFSQISLEKVIALRPDLVILPVYAKKQSDGDGFLAQLTQAKIPVIYVDFRVDQLNHTVPSLHILGEALNDGPKAERFITFYQQHMAKIETRLARAKPTRPTVMLQLHLGDKQDCCTTVGRGNLADLLDFAGGDNIAARRFTGVYGKLSPEALLTANPAIYIATGMGGPQQPERLQLGSQIRAEQAKLSFAGVVSREKVVSGLAAVQKGNAWAVWHNFYMSPWHLLDVEFFAKTFHPALFADVDPQQTLDEMNREFLSVKETGTYWTRLK
ncbi:ABC transporter substrate-binding protein [Dryocola sp. BD626]|uniref:ABC transporter substrate-binding protein n=1 Tax=Dryocola sp. BD626 TaxID=3133273 RepID=UPI003F4F8B2E